MKKKTNKGIIPIWVIGILTTVTMGYASLTTATLFNHSETNAEQDTQISLNENNIEHLKEIMEDVKQGQNLLLDNFGIPRQ